MNDDQDGTPQPCSRCGGTYKVSAEMAPYLHAVLPDRFMALEPVPCDLKCENCGSERTGWIRGLDVETTNGRIHFTGIDLDTLKET